MNQTVLTRAALFAAAALAAVLPAQAIILHPGEAPTSTPVNAVVGRWDGNASAVAVSSQHIITTRHQGGGLGTQVTLGGTTYVVAEITNASGKIDLRVARLETLGGEAANLTDWVGIYEQIDQVGQSTALGGFGEGRGANIEVFAPPGTVIGYEWDGNQGTQRWGANLISGSAANVDVFGNNAFINDTLTATFEDPTTGVEGEATLARGDSGGGWFINDGGVWKVAALSQGVQNTDEAIFSPPEVMTGVRLSSYADFINTTVPEPSSAALLLLAAGACMVRRRRA